MKISHVVGPQGCGKTLNAALIAEFLGCDAFGDYESPFKAGYNARHALALSNDMPDSLGGGDQVFQFFHLRNLILRDSVLGDRWRDPEPVDPGKGVTLSGFLDRWPTPTDAAARVAEPGFQIGSLVRLTPASPDLTIIQVNEDDSVWCAWKDESGQNCETALPGAWLTPAARQTPAKMGGTL